MKSSKLLHYIACFVAALLVSVIICSAESPAKAASYSDNQRVKIGLLYGSTAQSSVKVTCSAGFMIVEADETTGDYTPIYQTTDTSLTLKNSGGNVVVFGANGNPIYTGSSVVYIRGNNNSLKYDSKIYLELVKFVCSENKLSMINVLSLENYIKGVLPKEIYPSWHEEALKTAAVVARSFALSSLSGKHTSLGFDVCNTTCCQMFGGNGNNETARTNAAVDATRHIVLAYGDDVALTVYTSSTGDSTESAAGAWGGSEERYPYLVSVPTPFETPREYPNGYWSSTVSSEELISYLNSKSNYAGKLSGKIASIVCEYGESGYVRKITVTDTNGNSISAKNSSNVRDFLYKYVKSAKFEITPNHTAQPLPVEVMTGKGQEQRYDVGTGSYVLRAGSEAPEKLFTTGLSSIPLSFTITGVGYGHGVGLSQFGAMTLANSGKTYEEILATYFPGTYLTTLSGLGILDALGEIE